MNIEQIANRVNQIAKQMKPNGIIGIMTGYDEHSIQMDYDKFLEKYDGKKVFQKRTPNGYIELFVIIDGVKINAVTRAETDTEPESRTITIPAYHAEKE